jgi:hypothetical protein
MLYYDENQQSVIFLQVDLCINYVLLLRWFETYKQIYRHVTKDHFENNQTTTHICNWTGCDGLPRQRWSFMTHLQVIRTVVSTLAGCLVWI